MEITVFCGIYKNHRYERCKEQFTRNHLAFQQEVILIFMNYESYWTFHESWRQKYMETRKAIINDKNSGSKFGGMGWKQLTLLCWLLEKKKIKITLKTFQHLLQDCSAVYDNFVDPKYYRVNKVNKGVVWTAFPINRSILKLNAKNKPPSSEVYLEPCQTSTMELFTNDTIINWLYILIMSRTHFRVNLHSIVAWMSRNSLVEAGTKSEV